MTKLCSSPDLMQVCYSLRRRETIVAVKGMTMSRYIKSAKTLKARVGKQVKVDGERFDVSYEDNTVKLENETQSYEIADTPVAIDRFLRVHNVASSGYKFKQVLSSGYILDKECRITLKPYIGNFDDVYSSHTIIGMITRCRDKRDDLGFMILTNDEHLKGDPAKDKKGYSNSWWLGLKEKDLKDVVEYTEPLTEPTAKPSEEFTDAVSKIPLNKPVKVQFKMYPGETYEGMFKRCHKTDGGSERIFFLSNHTCFDGCDCWTSEREGYKYSWSMTSQTSQTTTTYEFKIVGDAEAPKKVPLEKLEEKEYSLLKLMGDESTRKTVKGVVKELRGISYLLSNDEDFDGNHPDAVKGTDYEYGWWLCEGSDISKSDYAIREVSEESKCAESGASKDPLARIAEALERIATALEK